MKYIIMQRRYIGGIREVPILFPNELVHSHVAKALLRLPGNPYNFTNHVSAAGDVELGIDCITCSGRSDTLNISSRGEEDARLIELCEYGFGNK